MALLGEEYASSDEGDLVSPVKETQISSASTIVAAPDVSLDVWPMRLQMMLAKPTDTSLSYNVPYEDLSRPSQGPSNPFKTQEGNASKRKNILTGHAEEIAISDTSFTTQHRTFQSLGYTKDPSGSGAYVGNMVEAELHGGKDVIQMRPSKEQSAAIRRKRQKKGDASIVDGEGAYKGPWAKYEDEDQTYEEEAALATQELASDEEWIEEAIVPTRSDPLPKLATEYASDMIDNETSEFHGESMYDYQGRTYMHVPQGRTYMHVPQDLDIDLRKDPGTQRNYIPKKLIHTFRSHTKAINALRFFPRSGHLLLSACADTKLKLWDVYHARDLLRTFSGHTKSVTDTTFTPSGTQFLSASYDRQMKLWDTETGSCISRFSTGKTPHCVAFNPSAPTEFLAGMSDKKIVQFDTRLPGASGGGSGEGGSNSTPTQEYDHHLGPVNTITFVDENRRFITTSDDKSLRAWEYNIPVPIKFIAEPYMYALVRASPHPNGKSVAFQSADNQIVVYASTDRFRQNRKKSFRGHNNAGYAIDLDISPDGQFVMSGDSGGFVCFWDWKTGRMWHKIEAGGKGAGAVVCCKWHPQESSKVVTGGLDGDIRYWD